METQKEIKNWGYGSASWWLTLIIALGIIFIGARFILAPQTGATGYGITIANVHDYAYGQVKGVRDIFLGIMLLPLLWRKMRTAAAYVFTATIIVPIGDFLIILSHNGTHDVQHLLIHGITVIYMAVTSYLLFSKKN